MFFEFLIEQWILVSAWMVLLALLINHESRKSGQPVTPQQLSDLVNREGGVVVDIRDAAEFKKGHIVDAINIPFQKFEQRLSELNEYKEKPVIIVCKIGQHAGGVSKQLKTGGFEKVYKLAGGIGEWNASNFPLVK